MANFRKTAVNYLLPYLLNSAIEIVLESVMAVYLGIL